MPEEEFMKELVKQEIKNLIDYYNLNCSIEEFKDKVHWGNISYSRTLSEDFIREFKDKMDWHNISCSQKLSEYFIREFKDKVYWYNIFIKQELSGCFIKEFKYRT